MRNRRLNSCRMIYVVLSFHCLALGFAAMPSIQPAKTAANKSVKSIAQLSAATTNTTTRARYNGRLVFTSDRQNDGGIKLWTMNPDGSNPTQLTFESDRGPTLPSYTFVYDSGPKWSPDGTKIAFTSTRDYDADQPYSIYIMDYPSRNVQRLIFKQLASLCGVIFPFEWSPDGSKFVLPVATNSCQGPFTSNIYTVNTDGSGLMRLTNDRNATYDTNIQNYYPTWSPDGGQIAFLSGNPTQGYTSLQVMNADGSNRHQILNSYSWTAHWSLDGSKILFAYASQLYTVKPDGTDLRQLTHPPPITASEGGHRTEKGSRSFGMLATAVTQSL